MQVFLSTKNDCRQILVTGIPNDEGFEPFDNCYFRTADSPRWDINRFIKEQALNAGLGHRALNTEKWVGTTGWTFYQCGDGQHKSVLSIAEALAALYGVPLTCKD